MSFIAALPMYEWPETRADADMQWERLRPLFRRAEIDAPAGIVRRNSDMPAVPGGIRDGEGKVIAPDPATLPPDDLDFQTLWRHPDMLLTQTCWGPMELGLADHIQVVDQPSYDGFEGGQGIMYSSAIVMREGRGIKPSRDGAPVIPLNLLRGKRFAFNGPDSMSGIIAPTRDLEAMGESLDIFSERIETGTHRASIIAVAEGRADVAAIDCRSWHTAKHHEPKAAEGQVVGWTGLRKGLPMITSHRTPPEIVKKLIGILKSV